MNPRIAFLLLLTLLLAACSQSLPTPTATATEPFSTPAPIVSSPTASHASIASTPTLIPTMAPFSSLTISPAVEGTRLRAGPGTMFEALLLLNSSDTLTVQGQSPGGDWIQVATADGIKGWILTALLEQNPALQSAPLIEPENAQEVRGRLTDFSGLPISGVLFALTQGTGRRTDATTDVNGEFHAFFPMDMSGDWMVSYIAIGCTSNAFADSSCSGYKSGYSGIVQPDSLPVTLPTKDILSFQWN
jgi:hypothetical protein